MTTAAIVGAVCIGLLLLSAIAGYVDRIAKALEALTRIEAGREARTELMLHGTDTTADRQDLDR